MWYGLSVFCALTCVTLSAPLSSTTSATASTPCPESCECSTLRSGHLEIRCSSLNFLEKLQPKQVNAIVSLDSSGQNLTHLHSKLKKLRNLKSVNLANNNIYDVTELSFLPKLTYLNLKSNHIKYFTASSLSKHLKHFDISHNYLTYIPQELKHLRMLKEVNFYDNPISCSCDILKERDLLLNAGVVLVKPVTCHSPEKLRGQLLQVVNCTESNDDILDHMQGDEGSGDDDTNFETEFYETSKNENFTSIEDEEFIRQSPKKLENIEEEGSGFGSTPVPLENEEEDSEDEFVEYEASGEDELTTVVPVYIRPKACNFDCSTLSPLNISKSGNESDPDVINEIRKGLKDILYPGETEIPPTTTTEEAITEIVITSGDVDKVSGSGSRNHNENERIINEPTDSPQEAGASKSSMNTNLIVVIALVVIMMCLVVFSILKKRKAKRKQSEINEQEMKPLNSKPTNGNNSIPEKTPLMNGQNGNMNGKPVEEPVERNEDSMMSPSEDDVNLRKKNKEEEGLLHEAHRVTIQAKELSTPKTPLLVNRLRSDDGQIITTPSIDQHH